MNIQFIEPLSRAWNRMKKALFQPFDLGKWFTVGFTAFLATLLDYPGGGGGGNQSNRYNQKADWDTFFNFPGIAREWLMEHTFWFAFILFAVFFLIILTIVFTWLSSRGKFMFLHNVVLNEAEVVKPWREYSREGNSLFIWRLVFGFIIFAAIISFLAYAFLTFRNLYYTDAMASVTVSAILAMIFQFILILIIIGYISLFLDNFVVPIMYKHRLTTSKAWYKFFTILWKHFGYFLLYGIFIFLLGIVVVIAIIFFGLFTCCLGFLLLIIPYIGSVVILPITYLFRAYSVEFLEQFGDDFEIFPRQTAETGEIQST